MSSTTRAMIRNIHSRQTINEYTIYNDTVSASNSFCQFTFNTINDAFSRAAKTPGCTAVCHNTRTNTYTFKGPNPSQINGQLSPNIDVTTYELNDVVRPIRRVDLNWKAADPFVTKFTGDGDDNVFYYAQAASSGVVYLRQSTGDAPNENMFDSNDPSKTGVIIDFDQLKTHFQQPTWKSDDRGNILDSSCRGTVEWAGLWSPKIFKLEQFRCYILTFTAFTVNRQSEFFFLYLEIENRRNILSRYDKDRRDGWKIGNRGVMPTGSGGIYDWIIDASVYELKPSISGMTGSQQSRYYCVCSVNKPNRDPKYDAKTCGNGKFTVEQRIGIFELKLVRADPTKTYNVRDVEPQPGDIRLDRDTASNVIIKGIKGNDQNPAHAILDNSPYKFWEISRTPLPDPPADCPSNNKYPVNEGPYMFINPVTQRPNIVYSGNFYVYPNYCLGILRHVNTITQILANPRLFVDNTKWIKEDIPLSASDPTRFPNKNCYGPGGFKYVTSSDGKRWAFYHVTPNPKTANGTRVIVFHEFEFDANTGLPILGCPTLPSDAQPNYLDRPSIPSGVRDCLPTYRFQWFDWDRHRPSGPIAIFNKPLPPLSGVSGTRSGTR